MEVESLKTMFSRSEELYGGKCGNYIDDDDSKTLVENLKLNPYNDEVTLFLFGNIFSNARVYFF